MALVVAGGCAPTQKATIVPPTAAGAEQLLVARPGTDLAARTTDASRGAIDPRVLPAPREPIAAAPDLSDAQFTVTDATLKRMVGDGLPSSQANSLAVLKGRTFNNVTEFEAAVTDRLGHPAAEGSMPTILRHALIVKLADVAELPETKADLQPAEGRPGLQGAAVPVLLGSMGSDRFRPVFFDFDKSSIKKEFSDAVAFNVKVLLGDKKLNVIIEGHCDERGSTEYNLALGERRAEALRRALTSAGVPASQIKTVSFGEERPADSGHNEAAWTKNRRAVINLQ